MNFVIVCNQYSRGNGGASSLIDLGRAAERAGARVDTLVTHQSGLSYIRAVFESTAHSRRYQLFRAPLALQRRPSIRGGFADEIGQRLIRASIAGLDVFKSGKARARLAQADVILVSGLGTFSDFGYLRSINSTARLVFNHPGSPSAFLKYWLHGGEKPEEKMDLSGRRAAYAKLLSPYDNILFQSPMQAEELARLFPAYATRTIVIRPGVDEDSLIRATTKSAPHIYSNEISLIMVGSVQDRKNQLEAIKIMRALSEIYPQVKLHIVGGLINNHYRKNLETEISASNLSGNIIFHGHRRDYVSLMSAADILLHTAKAEGVPRVLREAMFLKVPIVATNISGVSDLLCNNKDAFLYSCGEVDEAVLAITRLIESPDDRSRLVKSARDKFDSLHSYCSLEKEICLKLLKI